MSDWWIYVLAAPSLALWLWIGISMHRVAREAMPKTRAQRAMLRWNRFNALLLPSEALSERGQRERQTFGRLLGAFLTVWVVVFAIALALNGCHAAIRWLR